ncbi:tyrosine-type DNA invertase [Serratia ureilytica]|uniref:tyrosine-type DNA invertase n=1 Tax=Serratia ureilytica TaxID=300181 RepID=UPI002499C672|nr:tyrosine-type DNA invertase [Serratia ureilytica]MDI3197823.1 tyrosine-type DNA invertase [Serratia ureilytica]
MSKRKYLSRAEIKRVVEATKCGKYSARDECLMKLCFFHGFRVSELCGLRVSDVNLEDGVIHVRRLKNGFSTTHPILPGEKAIIARWLSERTRWVNAALPWLFLSQKGNRLSRQQAYNLLKHYGSTAGISVPLHPHMLRHSCGFALANYGADTRLIQDYLGHRNIHHTVWYTASNAERFNDIWRDGFID